MLMLQYLDMNTQVKIEDTWKRCLQTEFSLSYMKSLSAFLKKEQQDGKTIFPQPHQYFSALNLTPFDKVKVVILGQDPYHGAGQAHGLCFSVAPDVRTPPSLMNIYKELKNDLAVERPDHGCLVSWAAQGVLLLNSVLTVEESKASSHQKKGWEQFTDKIITLLNDEKEAVVFILWGAHAQKKGAFIDREKHLVIEGLHPSPLSAHRGFFDQHYFSRTNAYLKEHGHAPIDWSVPKRKVAAQYFAGAERFNRDIFEL